MERKTDHLEDGESILEDFLKESMACLAQEDEQVAHGCIRNIGGSRRILS